MTTLEKIKKRMGLIPDYKNAAESIPAIALCLEWVAERSLEINSNEIEVFKVLCQLDYKFQFDLIKALANNGMCKAWCMRDRTWCLAGEKELVICIYYLYLFYAKFLEFTTKTKLKDEFDEYAKTYKGEKYEGYGVALLNEFKYKGQLADERMCIGENNVAHLEKELNNYFLKMCEKNVQFKKMRMLRDYQLNKWIGEKFPPIRRSTKRFFSCEWNFLQKTIQTSRNR